jgi:Zn-dependent protease with chaperone function/TPR repeat protein
MKLKQLIATLVLATFTSSVFTGTGAWYDLRKIANSSQSSVRLSETNEILTTQQTRSIVEAIDKLSLLSGIYPKVYLYTGEEFNAYATFSDGQPIVVIYKPMYDYLTTDPGAAAALLGHEIAHLYFRHGISRAENSAAASLAGFVIGLGLEILFQGRIGVIGLGANIGNAVEKAAIGAFTRPQESQADNQGLIWAIQAGYDPNGAARLFTEMRKRSGSSGITFFNTHPSTEERMQKAHQTAEIYKKYKPMEVQTTPELMAMNRAIDEDYERLLPISEEGKNGVMAFSAGDYPKAKSLFEICAVKGEVACLNNIGVINQFGLGGVTVDLNKAAQFYKEAADKGSGKSLHNYIGIYAKSDEGSRDLGGLMKMQKQAAEMGSPGAMGTYVTAAILIDGFGASAEQKVKFEQMYGSQDTLVNYAKTASMRGVKDGYTALGVMYLDGYGVQKNVDLAEMYLLKAADQGDIRAPAFLLIIYDQLKIDADKALAIRTKFVKDTASEDRINKLSGSYYCKKDNSKDKLKICFEGAKKRRFTISGSYLYGTLLIAGMGTDRQLIEGMAWVLFSKDALQNPSAVSFFDKIVASLSPDTVLKIQARSKEISTEASVTQ